MDFAVVVFVVNGVNGKNALTKIKMERYKQIINATTYPSIYPSIHPSIHPSIRPSS